MKEDSMSEPGFPYLLSLVEDGIFVLDRHREVRYMNAAAARIFDSHVESGSSSTFIEIVRDYECDALVRKCQETGSVLSASVKTRGKNLYLDIMVSPDAGTQDLIVIIRDLTEKHHLEEIRRDFISNVSHEFRTPISSIRLIAETLIDNPPSDREVFNDFLCRIKTEAEKLTRMTDELTDLSMIEQREAVLNKDSLQIAGLVRQAVARLQPQVDKKGLTMKTEIGDDLPALVMDRFRIEQVLLNLVYNAVKFTPPGGSITISVQKKGGEILVSVSDTGIGIPNEELPRVFERFYKVNRARDDEGSGLGLAISRHIISAHGGKIWAESEEGKGSVFFFTLPLSAQPGPENLTEI